ncbi:GDSL-type esterase/lipase family protein [Kitasatospora sp. SUK 42]|uniref:GDSL-type esterase/lipase family protein n=1 Tax=Kitasatospora sp. SUK 42 TaxID=1588882 RepID=UPI0018CA4B3E|nr:GDSL-type esterase/lipase family protein [Kitasatospora sp. SUK 42]MBV2156725.1 RICIN domain-containing protein [Kitasatospora sp. SUK 42]
MRRHVRSRLTLLTVAGALAAAAPALSPAAAATPVVSSGGVYTLANVHSTKLMDVQHASTSPGAPVPQWHDNGGANQEWLHRKLTRPTRVGAYSDGLMAYGQTYGATFHNQTIRMIAHTSVSGSLPRVRLSNLYGSSPLTVGAVDLAQQSSTAGTAVTGTHRTVTFNGSTGVTIPAGQDVFSDPVPMGVGADQDLLVSVYLPNSPAGADTWHQRARENTWISTTGNHVTDDGTSNYPATSQQWFVLAGLDVTSPTATGTLVAVGDSITDGVGSTPGANHRWPDDLARRMAATSGGTTRGLVDAGTGSNRILTDAGANGYNKSLISRFQHDVLSQPDVKDVIMLEGINDIGDNIGSNGTGPLTATDLENGMLNVIRQAHAAGVKIIGGTILPYQGAKYYTTYGEQIRATVNRWILTSGAFDGVIDFDEVMQDPGNPPALNPTYDSGDHLHPNDAGYQAMADAVDLSKFVP